MIFAIIDIETTGGSPKTSKITEIAVIKHDGNKILDRFVTLLNPEMPIPEFIVRLTGINDQMVENAPRFFEIAKEFLSFTEDCIFVAHNVGFDYGMIRQEFKRLGFDYRSKHLCTVRSSRFVIPGHDSYSLGKLSRSLGISINGRHRAEGDAAATADLFTILMKQDSKGLQTFIQEDLNPKVLNPNLDLEALEEIPDRVGIYKFYNEFSQLIYVGKSKHIRKRIDQHLKNTKTVKGLQLIKEIQRIDYELTGSELIALMYESNLVKEHRPIYNTALKKNLFPYALIKFYNESNYLNLSVISSSKVNELDALTYFSTKKDATNYLSNLCEIYELCQKFCNTYLTDSACFNYNIKKCKGACIKEELAEEYNLRVLESIERFKTDGLSYFLIGIGREKSEKSIVLIEDGQYRGYGFIPYFESKKNPHTWKRFLTLEENNRDTKSILSVFLRQNPSANKVPL